MNKYLPTKEELIPITEQWTTFQDCGFNKPFDELSFKQQLQVATDIVRQSIMATTTPDIDTHVEELRGNCHTAALAGIEYLKYLGLGVNHRYVLARVKKYDPIDVTTTHALILVDDDKGETYQVDATPFVGYHYGQVKSINEEKFYLDYREIDEMMMNKINTLWRMVSNINARIDNATMNIYINILDDCAKYDILWGFVSKIYKLLSKVTTDDAKKKEFISKSKKYNPCDRKDPRNLEAVYKRIGENMDLLNKAIVEDDFKMQLEQAQDIVQELSFIDPMYDLSTVIQGKEIRLSHITPRFLMEHSLTTIVIKPSAQLFSLSDDIKERLCGNQTLEGYYQSNLAKKTVFTNISPMMFSHPLGEKYIRSMDGCAEVFLIHGDPQEICNAKKILREEYGKELYGTEVEWYDGEPILWHPRVTNYIHSADDPSESCLHYLIGYPEYQLMTRYMYPNRKLLKK